MTTKQLNEFMSKNAHDILDFTENFTLKTSKS